MLRSGPQTPAPCLALALHWEAPIKDQLTLREPSYVGMWLQKAPNLESAAPFLGKCPEEKVPEDKMFFPA